MIEANQKSFLSSEYALHINKPEGRLNPSGFASITLSWRSVRPVLRSGSQSGLLSPDGSAPS